MKRMRKTALALVLTLVFQMNGGVLSAWALTPEGLTGETTAIHTGQADASDPSQSAGEPEDSLPPGETGDSNVSKPPVNPDDTKPPTEAENPDGQLPPAGSGDSNDTKPPVNPDDTKPPTEAENPDGQLPPSGSGDSNDTKPPVNPDDTKPPTEAENPDGQLPPEQAVTPENQIAPPAEPVPPETGQIHSADELRVMSNGSYKLTADIDLTGQNWISMDFSGTLDGDGHTVTLDGAPLFGSLSGTVTNLVLDGSVRITEDKEAGPLALTLTSKGSIRNCAAAVALSTTDNVWSDVGGLVGTLDGGFIGNCVLTGTFQIERYSSAYGAAGNADAGTFQNCYWSNQNIRKVSGGFASDYQTTDCGQKSKADMQSTGFLRLINRNKQEGDLSWGLAAKDGSPVPGGKFPGKEVDKAALQSAVDQVRHIVNAVEKPYTSDSWEEFDRARTAAADLLTDETAAQSQVDAAAEELNQAQAALTFLNLDALKKAVEDGEKIENTGDSGHKYTPDSWKTLQDALKAAKAILEGQAATQRQADSRVKAIQDAISGLKEDLFETTNRAVLTAAIEAASSVDFSKIYTKAAMSAFQTALKNAKAIQEDRAANQVDIDGAAENLKKSQAGLSERSAAMATIPSDAIHITNPEQLLHLEDGKCYVLDKDMELYVDVEHSFGGKTLTERKWDGASMNCVLDGQGHTLTLLQGADNPKDSGLFDKVTSKAVFTTIGPDGVVQNLGVMGKTLGYGSIASECGGTVANCWARMDLAPVRGFGGLAGKLDSGGILFNSYAVAKGRTDVGLAASGHSNSLIQNGYWLGAKSAVGSGTPKILESSVKAEIDFTSAEGVVKLLNAHRGEQGREWHRDGEGYPYFGEEKEFQPPQVLDITLTLQDGSVNTFSSEDGLTISVFDADGSGTFGTLSCGKYAKNVTWKDVSGSTASDFRPISVNRGGSLSLQDGPGSTKIGLFDQAGHELARFALTVNTEGTVTDTKFTLSESTDGGKTYNVLEPQDGIRTVAGRVLLKADMEVKLEGKDGYRMVYPGLFDYKSSDGKVLSYSYNNYLNTKNPGTAELTITAKPPLTYTIGMQKAAITSTYVPVESIDMAIGDSYVLHDRTAPTTEAPGTFVPISMNHPTFTPDNASYQDDWTITSSDPSVANYLTTMVYGFVAEKAGTTTFTASTQDPDGKPVTFSKTVTFTYKNPVSSVTMKDGQKEFTVPVGDTLELPLVWKGVNDSSEHPCHVTEADMTWKVEGTGNVQINRAAKSVGSDYPNEKWVSNPVWRVIGTGQGDVIVTGVPVDQTQKAKPVTFTVRVTAGGPQKPVDHNELVQKGMAGAQSFLAKKTTSYGFGKEWEVFSLMRSGGSIPTAEVEKYLSSVEQTYKSFGGADQKASGDNQKPTTIARTALALGALNQDASNFRGIDFIHMLCSSDRITDGSNESIWALIALDTRNFNVPPTAAWDRDKLIAEILRYQNTDNGGFGLTDNKTTGVDMTAMALQGLAPYQQRPDVGSAVSKALDYLRKAQNVDGGFGNLESGAQVLTALCALKIDPLDSKNGFVQPAGDIITNMMSYYDETSGGFSHASGSAAEPMSSAQALYSLEAYQRFQTGENRLYDLTDADPRAVLTKRLAEAEKLVEKDYTPQTWAVFAQAKAHARAVLDRSDATAEELSAAGGQLANAMIGLKRADNQEGVVPQPTGQIKVSFRLIGAELSQGDVDLGKGTANAPYKTWIRTKKYTLNESSTVYDLFTQALNGAGLRSAGADSNYVRTVYAPAGYGGYALSEFTNGKYSGWMYTVNGKHPDVGLQYYKLKDGDQVIWHYVNDYRYEVEDWRGGSSGNASIWNGWLSAPDTDPPAKPVIPVVPGTTAGGVTVNLNPQVSVVIDGESKVQLTGEDISRAVEQAKKSGASSIVIQPQVMGEPSKVTVILPKSSIGEIADQTAAGLTVKTAAAHISISNKALDGLALEKGDTVAISAETMKEKSGQANGKISIAIQVDGRTLKELSGGILVTVPAEQPSPAAVLMQVTDQGDGVIRKSAVNGKSLTALLDGSATVAIQDNDKSFPDVPADYWGKDAVSFAVSHQLFYGTEENTFDPSGDMTRSMLAAVLWRLDGEEEPKETAEFRDVSGGWYAQAVQWAAESDIVQGDGGIFRPDSPITRQELAAMLYRYMENEGRIEKENTKPNGEQDGGKQEPPAVTAGSGLSRFSDRDQLAPWACDSMEWAVDAGLISGKDGGLLDPNGEATRAEVAAVMQRSVSYLLQ